MMRDDSFFWFRETRLAIPGVRRRQVLMHISDTHVSTTDALSSEEERAETAKNEAVWESYKERFARGLLDFSKGNDEPYGDPQRIPTAAAFDKQMDLAAELKPDALLLSGDNLDHAHGAGERYLARKLAEYPGRFLCVPGNHEAPELPGVYGRGVRTLEMDGFRIAAVDDSQKTVTREDLDALRALCAEGVPLIVLCHIPISTPPCREELHRLIEYFYIDEASEDACAREFVSLCVNEPAVRAVLCGHVHGFHRVEIAPGKPQIIGSQGMAGAVHLVEVTGTEA